MRFTYLTIILIFLYGCTNEIDFSTGPVTACTNKYDSKDDIIYYNSDKSEYLSQSTGVTQITFIDVYGNRKMINEFEQENYICMEINSNEQVKSILND